MAIKIGHASIDENGKISGGQAGEQNGKEVCIREWYSKPWSVVLRPINDSIAEKSAKACEAGCANPNVGYDQPERNTAHTQAKAVGYDLSKVAIPCETDCSAFMTLCAIAGGVTELEYTGNAPTTSTMVNAFTKTGKYQALTDAKYLTSDKYLKRGDILVKPGSHTVMALENGSANKSAKITNISTNKSLTYPCRGVDVSAYQTNLNYDSIKNSGVKFAILKIIRKDGNLDKGFEEHYAGFSNTGVPVIGVYNYSYATTVEKAHIDALAVIKYLKGRTPFVCLDVEDNCQKNLGERLIDIINGYQKTVEDAGLKFVLYTGLSFWNSFIKPYQSKLNCRNNWIARYYNGHNPMLFKESPNEQFKPNVPNLIGWQYTSSCVVNGTNQRLDANIIYSDVVNKPRVKITTSIAGTVTANVLNVRDMPNTDGKVVGYLKKGESVTILEIDSASGWYKIGDSQYVSNKYIQI